MRNAALLVVTSLAALALAFGLAGSAVAQSDDANVTVYPGATESFENLSAIDAAIENGSLDDDTGFHGEPVIVKIDSERLASDMDEHDGSLTERFFAVENATFVFAERETGPMLAPVRVDLGVENTTVYRNGTTIYAVVDTGAAEHWNLGTHAERVEDSRIEHGVTMAAVFEYGLNMSDIAPPPEDAPGFGYYADRAWLTAPDRSLPLIPDVNEPEVRVYAEPDDEVELQVTLEDLRTISDTVSGEDDRPFSLDLRDVEPGTAYTLELRFDGHVAERYIGTVTAPEASIRNVEVVNTTPDSVILNVTAEATHRSPVEVRTDLNVRVDREWIDPGEGTVTLTVPREDVAEDLQIRVVAASFSPMHSYEGEKAERGLDLTDVVDEDENDNESETGNDDGRTDETPTPTPSPGDNNGDGTDGDGDRDDRTGAGDDDADGFGDGLTVVAGVVALALVVAITHRRQRR